MDLKTGYLVVGTDEFARSRFIAGMRARLEASGMADFNLDERDMAADPAIDDVVASLNTLPMGADFRLVILMRCDHLDKAVTAALVSYFKKPCGTTACLVVADRLLKTNALYKAVAATGELVDCKPLDARRLPDFVLDRAKERHVEMGAAAARELVDRVGENPRMLDNQVGRLGQQLGGRAVTVADVERLVARTADAKPWPLLDAVSARDLPKSLELLALQPKNSEVLTFTLLTGRIRELMAAKSVAARRGGAHELASVLGKQDWQVRNHLRWVRGWTAGELEDALRGAIEVELALKGSRDSGIALERWVAGMAGGGSGRVADARRG